MFSKDDKLASLLSAGASAPRRVVVLCALVFLLAFGVRLLAWHDGRLEAARVQSEVTKDYKHVARLLADGGAASFFSSTSLLADYNTLGHPPGYSIVLAVLFKLFGETDTAAQFLQIIVDALCACLVLLLAAELLPRIAALLAGLLVAFAPQYTWNSIVVLPDTLAVAPLLLAVYVVVRARRQPRLLALLAAGALVGVSCWLRANAMLLAPFLAALVCVLFESGRRVRYASALICGALCVIAPLTIRNALVFGRFIPLSLGAGQTLLEGIADYDPEGRFGIPSTDMGIMRQEAAQYGRPDWAGGLFGAEGIERERMRLRRGFAVIRAHPFWFAGVMMRRAAGMLRLERARLVAADPPVAHSLEAVETTPPVWTSDAARIRQEGSIESARAQASLAPDGRVLELTGDDSKYGAQFASPAFPVEEATDYAVVLPVQITRGRMTISIVGVETKALHAATIIDTTEARTAEEQPLQTLVLPFVSRRREPVRLLFSNTATPVAPFIRVGTLNLHRLGAASYTWTRPLRALARNVQKLFVTAVMLPLALVGLALLVRARRWQTLAVLLVVPAYFFCVQSALHTEYRYVLIIHHFLFVAVATTLYWMGATARDLWQRRRAPHDPQRPQDSPLSR
ncbi:MAG TPA: glycosyltransferase family 39 protein [Pyrinomonadaceae bacterium]|nr:glycosyltransferase family 39 protein [Pyrinomonadaceae bacterium]